MKNSPHLAILLMGATILGFSGVADPLHARRGDQDEARQQMRAGNVRSLREIERSVLPKMQGMEYLGPEYDARSMVYRLKFISDGRVVFVDVDARSGAVVGQSR